MGFKKKKVNDQHSALEISDLPELTVRFGGTVAETASVPCDNGVNFITS
jgi:hypothetical protein